MKEKLLLFLAQFISDIKDPKTLIIRLVIIVFLLMSYLIIDNPEYAINLAKEFSKATILEALEEERRAKLPEVISSRSILMFSQTSSEEVYIAIYEPEGVNDYLIVESQAGSITLFEHKEKLVLRKTSEMYLLHISSLTFSETIDNISNSNRLAFKPERLEGKGIEYFFSCPIFSLYTDLHVGHIGFVYSKKPEEEKIRILTSICMTNARAIGKLL